jgi:hypothetical protein
MRPALAVVLALMLAGTTALAQGGTAALTGRVTGPDEAPVQGE